MFNVADFYDLLLILLYFFVAGFAWYLPLKNFFRKQESLLRFVIPISLSLQILVAYLFYSLKAVDRYPVVYFGLVLLVNAALLVRKRFKLNRNWPKLSRDPVVVLAGIFTFFAFVYTRFFDSVTNLSPGAIDTSNHLHFVRDLSILGHISSPTYPPGFHLLVYPINRLVGDLATYRFVGPVLGLLVGINIYNLFQKELRTTTAKLLLFALFCFPVFYPISLQTISFFSSVISFILFPAIIYSCFDLGKIARLPFYSLLFLMIAALSTTVPYFFVQLIPAAALLLLLSWLFRKQFPTFLTSRVLMVTVLLLFGFGLGFLHTYLQNRITKSPEGFPAIAISLADNGAADESVTNYSVSHIEAGGGSVALSPNATPLQRLEANTFYQNYVLPMVNTGRDIIRLKGWRPVNSLASVGAYAWGLVSLFLIWLAIKRKEVELLVLASFGGLFSFATQTGVFEISSYQGRSGWYLLLVVIISLVFLVDRLTIGSDRQKLLAVSLVAAVGIIHPPTFYRPFYPTMFEQTEQLVDNSHSSVPIVLLANQPELGVLSRQLQVQPLNVKTVATACVVGQDCYALLETKVFQIDLVQMQVVDQAQTQPVEQQKAFADNLQATRTALLAGSFHLVSSSSGLEIYQK